MKNNMFYTLFMGLLVLSSQVWSAATITIQVIDGVGEGFNDPTPVSPIGGNTGTTLGQQRMQVFLKATEIWSEVINSTVEIKVDSKFDPLTCDMNGAVLGSAGSNSVFRNFSNAPFPNTFYSAALADSLAGVDQNPGNADINATFNSEIDNGCLNNGWYYGLDGATPTGFTALLPVVLHEIGHGLGFQTFTSGSSGAFLAGSPSIWDRFLFDLTANENWSEMTQNSQRINSAINTGNLVWTGPNVTAEFPNVLNKRIDFEIFSPGGIAGIYANNLASYGPTIPNSGINGDIVLANDNVGPDINDGCSAFSNDMTGDIALIKRGNCAFVTKSLNAQNAGAIGVIVANNVAGELNMGGVDPGTLTIASVGITQADGDTIIAAGAVTGGLNFSSTEYSGTNGGFVRMFAPNPFQSGSSVSHWDTVATPNLLMEPSITATIFDKVDLARQLFQDIGWSVNFDDLIFENGFDNP
jgi:hypothetical protein